MASDGNDTVAKDSTQLWMLRLQTIQTVVIVLGVIFALFELNNLSDERRHARYEVTAAMLSRFAEPTLIDGAAALMSIASLAPTDENYNTILARLTPLRQHYITWSACLAEGICLDGPSRDLFCQRLISYELAVSQVMGHFGRDYDFQTRGGQYFGQLDTCRADHSDWIEKTFQ